MKICLATCCGESEESDFLWLSVLDFFFFLGQHNCLKQHDNNEKACRWPKTDIQTIKCFACENVVLIAEQCSC